MLYFNHSTLQGELTRDGDSRAARPTQTFRETWASSCRTLGLRRVPGCQYITSRSKPLPLLCKERWRLQVGFKFWWISLGFSWNATWNDGESTSVLVQHCVLRYTHTYIHACMHAYIHTFIHSYIHTFIHSYIHTFIHSFIHTYIHMYIHIYR